MATVEIDTGKHVKRYDFWNPAMWAIPKLYWDAYSQEQRIHAICRQLEKVIRYADYVGVNVDDIAQRLQDIEDGKLDEIIVSAIETWFEEHATDITQRIDVLRADVDTIIGEIGEGFSSENTISNTLADEETARIEADEAINEKLDFIDYNMRGLDFNCRFRKIVTDDYNLSYNNSCQGMTMFESNGIVFFAQATLISNETNLIIYDYENMVETTRIVGTWGHINDIAYFDGVLYALDEENSTLHKFNTDGLTITYNGSVITPIRCQGIAYNEADGKFYLASSTGIGYGISINVFDETLSTLEKTYNIPFYGEPIIQGASVYGSHLVVANTEPNTLVYFNTVTEKHSYWNAPVYIGHCVTSEIEGVYIDKDKNIYFNTNSKVDLQLIASVFQTNLANNVEKEVTADEIVNRYSTCAVNVNYDEGTLVNPADNGMKFKLFGDAVNFAKSLGTRLNVTLEADYPHCITLADADVSFAIPSEVSKVTLNGIYASNCKFTFNNISKIAFEPTNIQSLVSGGVIYGGYMTDCIISIPISAPAEPETPYDATHKKINMRNCIFLTQEITYYNFYNCLVKSTSSNIPDTTTIERTTVIGHTTP